MAARKTAAKTAASSKATAKPATIAGIPITREEIEPLLGDEMPLFAYVYWNSFDSELTLAQMRDAIVPHMAELRAARKITLGDLPPPDGPDLYVELAGKQVGVTIKRLSATSTRWSLQADYRAGGEAWGSNHALFMWFARTILPWVDATDVRAEPLPHALTRSSRG